MAASAIRENGRQLRGAEVMRSKWIPAETAPKEWEGDNVWRWQPWDNKVSVYFLDRDYSRNPKHCGGLMFQKYEPPKPPRRRLSPLR